MIKILNKLNYIDDPRQQHKIKYSIKEIVGIVLFAYLANSNEWCDIEDFANENEDLLKQYFELPNGIPSHDTLARVMSLINPDEISDLYLEWNKYLSQNEGQKLKKIFNIDGKTMCGSKNKHQNAIHVVSVWSEEDGISLGQTVVEEKTNEITAIPELLKTLNIKGNVITIDAMGTQVKIAEQIIDQKANYVLAVKKNQGNLYSEIVDYFADNDFLKKIIVKEGYKKTCEKARGQIETREYYQTDAIKWMNEKDRWKKLKTIGLVVNTIEKDGVVKTEYRYYISSEKVDIDLFAKSTRGHWAIESMHWHLDVTFKEDASRIIDKKANENLNIIRKWSLSILKILEISAKKISLKRKRFRMSLNPRKYFKFVLDL
ncbi:MAG: ISAs1 family transposase [Cetobacterium sp.]